MRGRFLVGFRFPAEPESIEAVEPTLSRVKELLEQRGAILDGWEYDQPENLLLIHLHCEPEALPEAKRVVSEALWRSLGLRSEPVMLGPRGFVDVEEALPSPSTLGFLIRVAAEGVEHNGLGKGVLPLLIHYLCGFSRARTLLAASYLGFDPAEVDAELSRLAEQGYLSSDLRGLTREGEKLLNSLLPKLRIQPRTQTSGGIGVVDEEGSLEPFNLDKLAASLHGCGVPYAAVPTVLEHIERALRGRRYVSRRVLALLTRSLLDEVLPATGSAERFYHYVYALDRLYVEEDGVVRRLSWKLLREASLEVLSERGLKPPRRLVQLHAERVAQELRELVASAPLLYEGRVLRLDELRSIARYTAPKVSFAWLDLAASAPAEVAERYKSLALNYLEAASGWDQGERKELTLRALQLLSSSIALKLGLLPSNSTELNLGALRSEVVKLGTPADVSASLLRICKLAARLIRTPAVPSPREQRGFERALSELRKELVKLPL
ncbi:MAG: hypothetical protein QXW23_02755 [Thermofilaceae archaeon]